jgi:hypothetical protein
VLAYPIIPSKLAMNAPRLNIAANLPRIKR